MMDFSISVEIKDWEKRRKIAGEVLFHFSTLPAPPLPPAYFFGGLKGSICGEYPCGN